MIVKKILAFALAIVLSCAILVGCSTKDNGSNTPKVTVRVDLHGWAPALTSTPTADDPDPYVAPDEIANEFMKQNPDIKIEWVRDKNKGTTEEVMQWFRNKIELDACPTIAFSWGTAFQDQDWYYDLTDIITQTNEFEPGTPVWKDMFNEYIWSNNEITTYDNKIVAIPMALHPGLATSLYYNESLFEQAGYKKADGKFTEPSTWKEFQDMTSHFNDLIASNSLELKEVDVQYKPEFHATKGAADKIMVNSWALQFNLGPSYIDAMMDEIDLDDDGYMSSLEILKGVKDGKFNPQNSERAKELYKELKSYYTDIVKVPINSIKNNYWIQGAIPMKEGGAWTSVSETNDVNKHYDVGIAPPPVATKDARNTYATEVDFVKGPANAAPALQLNIMKDAVKGNPELLDAAVKFLKFMTTTVNNSHLVTQNKNNIGSVKNSTYASGLKQYLSKDFPVLSGAKWPTAYTVIQNNNLDSAFIEWVNGKMTDTAFYAKVNEYQQAGADKVIENMKLTV